MQQISQETLLYYYCVNV